MMKLAALGLLMAVASGATCDVPLCGTAYAAECCKHCHKGKACGNSCIPADSTCHQPKGCACDG